jgi:hypothetical protein
MLGWQQKALQCSHVFLHSFIFWIENALHPLRCNILLHGDASLILVQSGCKSPKKKFTAPDVSSYPGSFSILHKAHSPLLVWAPLHESHSYWALYLFILHSSTWMTCLPSWTMKTTATSNPRCRTTYFCSSYSKWSVQRSPSPNSLICTVPCTSCMPIDNPSYQPTSTSLNSIHPVHEHLKISIHIT